MLSCRQTGSWTDSPWLPVHTLLSTYAICPPRRPLQSSPILGLRGVSLVDQVGCGEHTSVMNKLLRCSGMCSVAFRGFPGLQGSRVSYLHPGEQWARRHTARLFEPRTKGDHASSYSFLVHHCVVARDLTTAPRAFRSSIPSPQARSSLAGATSPPPS